MGPRLSVGRKVFAGRFIVVASVLAALAPSRPALAQPAEQPTPGS